MALEQKVVHFATKKICTDFRKDFKVKLSQALADYISISQVSAEQ